MQKNGRKVGVCCDTLSTTHMRRFLAYLHVLGLGVRIVVGLLHNVTVDDQPAIEYSANANWLSAVSPLNMGGSHMLSTDPAAQAIFRFTGAYSYSLFRTICLVTIFRRSCRLFHVLHVALPCRIFRLPRRRTEDHNRPHGLIQRADKWRARNHSISRSVGCYWFSKYSAYPGGIGRSVSARWRT